MTINNKEDLIRVAYIRTKLGANSSSYLFIAFDANKERDIEEGTDIEDILGRVVLTSRPPANDLIKLVLRSPKFMPWMKNCVVLAEEMKDEDGDIYWTTTFDTKSNKEFDAIMVDTRGYSENYTKNKVESTEVIIDPTTRKILR